MSLCGKSARGCSLGWWFMCCSCKALKSLARLHSVAENLARGPRERARRSHHIGWLRCGLKARASVTEYWKVRVPAHWLKSRNRKIKFARALIAYRATTARIKTGHILRPMKNSIDNKAAAGKRPGRALLNLQTPTAGAMYFCVASFAASGLPAHSVAANPLCWAANWPRCSRETDVK